MNKRWIEAAGYKDYDDYHRAHTKYHALTKKQEEKLKSSKAYKVGETVGVLLLTSWVMAVRRILNQITQLVI